MFHFKVSLGQFRGLIPRERELLAIISLNFILAVSRLARGYPQLGCEGQQTEKNHSSVKLELEAHHSSHSGTRVSQNHYISRRTFGVIFCSLFKVQGFKVSLFVT